MAKTQCAECGNEALAGEREALEIHDAHADCAVCDQPVCEWHGRQYRTGFEHVSCHEEENYTRAEDGEY